MSDVHIDTLSLTGNLVDREAYDLEDWCQSRVAALFPALTGFLVLGSRIGGVNGYTHGFTLIVDGVSAGHIALGGNCNSRGEEGYQVYLNGTGCVAVTCHDGWGYLADKIDHYRLRITRCDLAADFLKGEYSIDWAAEQYLAGGFDSWNKQRPQVAQNGDWLTGQDTRGRTLYVGNRQYSVKFLRVYEKGKQLGDKESPWVRYEVEYKRQKGYELSSDMLRRPVAFWCGTYSIFADMIKVAAEKLAYVRESVKVSFSHLMYHMKRAYGRLIRVADSEGFTMDSLLEGVPFEVPARMASVIAGYRPPVSNTGGVSEAALC